MATTLSGQLEVKYEVRIASAYSDVYGDDLYRLGAGGLAAASIGIVDGATTGAAATGKAQKHYHKAHTIASAGSVTLDMNALVDERGTTTNFATVIAVFFRIRTPVTGVKAVIGNAAADPWIPWLASGTVAVATVTHDVASLFFHVSEINGWAVPAAANLKIAASGGDIIIDVSFVGY